MTAMLATGYVYELLREFGVSPDTAERLETLVVRPLAIVLILLVALVVSRLTARWMRTSVEHLQLRTPLLAASPRAQQRAATIGDALSSVTKVVVWSIAVLLVFDQLGVNLAPLLAGAGIAGIAIGFGAQSLVKDVITGLFILLEDQYGVGDVVDLGGTAGTVEEVNLRVTRLRAVDGKVWFVPNGEIRQVGNASLEWARAVVDIPVGHGTDVDAAIGWIHEEIDQLSRHEPFSDVILEPPEVWGVEAVGPEGTTIRVSVKTAPQQQFRVAREVRARVGARLLREGATAPGRSLVFNPPPA